MNVGQESRTSRRATRCGRVSWVGVLALASTASVAAQDALPAVQASEPRAFGWRLGDVVEREVRVTLPPGWQLLPDSLPVARQDGRSLELRAIAREPMPGGERLRLRYQVMRSPDALRTVDLPGLSLQAKGPSRTAPLRVEAWPMMVGPLAPAEAPERRGLGPWQPDRAPPLPVDASRPWRLALEGALLALGLAGLARARWGAGWWQPWRADPRRPLAAAWRQLRRLPAQADGNALAAALRTLHRALDASAGQVLRSDGLPAFSAQRPAFAPLAGELQAFFMLSDAVFFAAQPAPADAADGLRRLARRLRDAERST